MEQRRSYSRRRVLVVTSTSVHALFREEPKPVRRPQTGRDPNCRPTPFDGPAPFPIHSTDTRGPRAGNGREALRGSRELAPFY